MKRKSTSIKIAPALIVAIAGGIFLAWSTVRAHEDSGCKFDLKIDSACSYNGRECAKDKRCGKYYWKGTGEECSCAWKLKDLDGDLFFDFDDLKPGDHGEDTISLHIASKDAWLCGEFYNLENRENRCTEPESGEDATCADPGLGLGELQDYLLFSVWRDKDCDNIADSGEQVLINGKPLAEGTLAVADSKTGTGVFKEGKTYCLGVKWSLPAEVGNIIQTDSVAGDIKFIATAAENRKNFVCGQDSCRPRAEVCDGKDNDCDGQTDEGPLWDNLGRVCTAGSGRCKKTGVYVCNSCDPAGKTVCSAKADRSCRDDGYGHNGHDNGNSWGGSWHNFHSWCG